MENPSTPLEMVDAAANYVSQIRLCLQMGDQARAMKCVEQAERLLVNATEKLDGSEE